MINTVEQCDKSIPGINFTNESSKALQDIFLTDFSDQYPKTKAHSLAICVHHGKTNANDSFSPKDGKDDNEPLNDKGIEEITQVGNQLLNVIPFEDRGKVMIHVAKHIGRNLQTAKIIKDILGLPDEQMIDTSILRTGKKGKNAFGVTVYAQRNTLVPNIYGTESTEKIRAEGGDYIAEMVAGDPNKIHIFITNRVSYKGFEDWKKNAKATDYTYDIPTGAVDIVPIANNGIPIYHIPNNNVFTYDEQNAIKEIKLLAKTLSTLAVYDYPMHSLAEIDRVNGLWMKLCAYIHYGIAKKHYNIIGTRLAE